MTEEGGDAASSLRARANAIRARQARYHRKEKHRPVRPDAASGPAIGGAVVVDEPASLGVDGRGAHKES